MVVVGGADGSVDEPVDGRIEVQVVSPVERWVDSWTQESLPGVRSMVEASRPGGGQVVVPALKPVPVPCVAYDRLIDPAAPSRAPHVFPASLAVEPEPAA